MVNMIISKTGLEAQREGGRKAMAALRTKYGPNLIKMTLEGKRLKRIRESKALEEKYKDFFKNVEIEFDTKEVNFSHADVRKKIKLPKSMSPALAEEIGAHLGDGCLSYNRNYFSIKSDKKEEGYFTGFLFKVYKELFNLDLRLMHTPNVCGFEICSKALAEFKNKVIGLPYGEKVERIKVPEAVLNTKNKEIYRVFLRGLFDTDGSVCLVKINYPVIGITIKSQSLISEVKDMLKKLGFMCSGDKWNIHLNGTSMLNKWIKEIGSNNPKNIKRLQIAQLSAPIV